MFLGKTLCLHNSPPFVKSGIRSDTAAMRAYVADASSRPVETRAFLSESFEFNIRGFE